MPETVAQVPTTIAPIDTLNKTELYRHLSLYHGSNSRQVTSKDSREAMEKAHAASHDRYDFTASATVESPEGGRVSNPLPPTTVKERVYYEESVHEHVVASAPTESDRELLESITVDGVQRVLSAGERKALEKLIDNDFASLRTEMIGYAAAILQERLEAVRAEFADKQDDADVILKNVQKAARKAGEHLTELAEAAVGTGIKVVLPSQLLNYLRDAASAGDSNYKAVVEGLADERTRITSENQNDLRTALNTLERQRLSAQRLVLIAGISAEGQKLLATVPSAKDLMVSAAGERAKALESTESHNERHEVEEPF